ncbi:hypothetical protein NA57DRAFT_71307 [Rhizodiscina lignyota]|uniref:Tautomerase cis-CaaD-like domain-containing protein n=1 Tax=Rhizodiscina lignyota TaxID=1504668 RepID=A0A9P4IS23_9PEZI|nr:hypothetical protein NA57DRAFT_71307 [Rhizodiscina lignyota]
MPLYDIEHVTPLTAPEKQALATAITDLHAKRFTTPKWFVNVRFNDASNVVVFRGGVERRYNRLVIRTRQGARSIESYNEHCRDIVNAWRRIMEGNGKGEAGVGDERGLRTVWVTPVLLTAVDVGVARPGVGEEKSWVKQHWNEFERMAQEGDEDMKMLVEELKGREEFVID